MNEIVSITNVTKLFQHEESLIVFWLLVMYILFYIYLYQFRNNDVPIKTEWQEHYLMPSWSLVNGLIDDDDWHRVVQEERSRASPTYSDHLSLWDTVYLQLKYLVKA